MWADRAEIQAGIGKFTWERILNCALPTDDLLLYAIEASVLQKWKQIIKCMQQHKKALKCTEAFR